MDSPYFIYEEQFSGLLQKKFGDLWPRAMAIFRNYGKHLVFEVAHVLVLAAEQRPEKVAEVLEIMEKHFDDHLSFQDPEIRGLVTDGLLGGVSSTQAMFRHILEHVLGLQPVGEAEE